MWLYLLYLLLRGLAWLILAAGALAIAALVAVVFVVAWVGRVLLTLATAGLDAVREPEAYRRFRERREPAALNRQPLHRRADDPSANPRWRR